jgi:general secretion pathway protein J
MNSRETGFTLIELLVALTLFGVLMTMLFMEFRVGIRSAEKVTEAIGKSTTLPTLQDFLRTEFAAARPVVKDGSIDGILSFDGGPEKLEFIGTPPGALSGALSGGGLQRIAIELLKTGGGRRLVLRRRLYQGKQSKVEGSYDEPLVLLDDVASLQLGYFGTTDPVRAPLWQDTWRDMLRLPSLVRLRLVLADGRQPPDLVVALRLVDQAKQPRFAQDLSR